LPAGSGGTGLFAFEHIAQRFQRTVPLSFDGTLALAVVKKCINSLLQHALFIFYNNIRRTESEQPAQTVVAVVNAR
jgi:hypothetical protein